LLLLLGAARSRLSHSARVRLAGSRPWAGARSSCHRDVGTEAAVQDLHGAAGERPENLVGGRLLVRGDQLQRPFAADAVRVLVFSET